MAEDYVQLMGHGMTQRANARVVRRGLVLPASMNVTVQPIATDMEFASLNQAVATAMLDTLDSDANTCAMTMSTVMETESATTLDCVNAAHASAVLVVSTTAVLMLSVVKRQI